MISKDKDCKLIEIYFYVCENFKKDLKFCCERFSNNNKPDFSDEEIMTIYLYITHYEQRFRIKQIHKFASDYLLSWFPKLPSYQAFDNRINRLHNAFSKLTEIILSENKPNDCCLNQSLLDSMPIITCSGKRNGKVAKEIVDKGYNSTKGMYFYGLKLHALAFRRIGKLPYPEEIVFTQASENDLNVFKQVWSNKENRILFGDKIYYDIDFF